MQGIAPIVQIVMASHPASVFRPRETESVAFFKVAALLLGFAVAVVGLFALLMWADARDARESGGATADAATAPHNHATDHNTALPLNSFAGVVPENAQALAEAHKALDARLPAAPAARGRSTATAHPVPSSTSVRARPSR